MAIGASVEKLYMWKPSLYAAATQVTSTGQDDKGSFVRLAQTIFHPQGGGQPFDIGLLIKANGEEVSVIGVQKELDPSDALQQIQNTFEIKHYVQTPSLAVGEPVDMEIDVPRRKLNASLHSAGHLIAAVVNEKFPNLKATGGHHIPGECRVDFKTSDADGIAKYTALITEFLSGAIAAKIAADKPVHILKSEEGGRSIQIEGYEGVSCGGTHVEHLGQIPPVEIRGVKKEKDTLRVRYTV